MASPPGPPWCGCPSKAVNSDLRLPPLASQEVACAAGTQSGNFVLRPCDADLSHTLADLHVRQVVPSCGLSLWLAQARNFSLARFFSTNGAGRHVTGPPMLALRARLPGQHYPGSTARGQPFPWPLAAAATKFAQGGPHLVATVRYQNLPRLVGGLALHSIGFPAKLLGLLLAAPSGSFGPPTCVLHCPRTSHASAAALSKCASPLLSSWKRSSHCLAPVVQPVQPGALWVWFPPQPVGCVNAGQPWQPTVALFARGVCLCLGEGPGVLGGLGELPGWPTCSTHQL
eukprot:369377-Amphidinium_carterae.1